jgi:hypothetical protein
MLLMAASFFVGCVEVAFGQNSNYEVIEGNFTWHEAKVDAEARGGHLATITSLSEQHDIQELMRNTALPHFWLGATDEETEGKWEWITGETWDFTNWNAREPSNDLGDGHYLNIWNNNVGHSKYFWNDWTANITMGYILEIAPKNIITSQPQSGSYAKGSTIVIKIEIDDFYESPFIQWFKNGQPLLGENTNNLTLESIDENTSGDYYALISADGKSETSDSAKVVILSLPKITGISENIVADEGETIELIVSASGTPPLSYQWKKIGGDSILSASSNLVLKKVDESDAGYYAVVVSSEGGVVTSPQVTVGVRPDTDNDGLLDHVEFDLGSDINKTDTDDDGVSDFDEVEIFSTSPTRADTDGDGLNDGAEVRGGFDPREPTESADGAISIGIAVELEFFTLTWNNYQLQLSTDLNTWHDVDSPFKGVGGYSSILQPAREANFYWRLIIVE